jgi:hypothetical protein
MFMDEAVSIIEPTEVMWERQCSSMVVLGCPGDDGDGFVVTARAAPVPAANTAAVRAATRVRRWGMGDGVRGMAFSS